MQAERVVQRELTGASRRVDRGLVVDLTDDRLAGTVHAARDDARAMRALPPWWLAGMKR
jgi:hypothetical protein